MMPRAQRRFPQKRAAPAGEGAGAVTITRSGETAAKNADEPMSSGAPLGKAGNATRFRWNRGETVVCGGVHAPVTGAQSYLRASSTHFPSLGRLVGGTSVTAPVSLVTA